MFKVLDFLQGWFVAERVSGGVRTTKSLIYKY